MATISKGYTFGSTETVTATKLHQLVDNATISGIVNADIDASANIAQSKLDLTGSGYLLSGSTPVDATGQWTFSGGNLNTGNFIGSLASIGTINTINTQISSLASIASLNTSYAVIASLATLPNLDVVNINGSVYSNGVKLLSTTTWSSNSTGNITIAANKLYRVWVSVSRPSSGDYLRMLVNADTTASAYAWEHKTTRMHGTATETVAGDDADSKLALSPEAAVGSGFYVVNFHIDTTSVAGYEAFIYGSGIMGTLAGTSEKGKLDFSGTYNGSSPTSFVLNMSGGAVSGSGTVKVYEYI